MAVATVTLRPGKIAGAFVTGKYVTGGSPSATNINVGFVPSRVDIEDCTAQATVFRWTSDMAAATGIKITSAGAAQVATNGVTSVAQTDGTNMGFLVGTDSSINSASTTYSFIAYP